MEFLSAIANNVFVQITLAGLFCYLLERQRPIVENQKYFKKELEQDLSLLAFNTAVLVPFTTFVIYPLVMMGASTIAPYQMFNDTIQSLPLLLQILLGTFLIDFVIYWRHRFTHYYMWRFHAIHHNAQEISWSTKFRLHPIDNFVAVLASMVFLYFVGFSGMGMLISTVIVTVMDYFNHSNFNFGFKSKLRYFISTPRYHRWHHAAAREALNKNFVVCFPFLDIIFGSYHYPTDRLPEVYGLAPKEQERAPKNIIGQFTQPLKRKP